MIETDVYNREKVLKTYYDGEHIHTPFHRKIKVDQPRALNYLIQSTTADLVMDRAIAIDKFLEGKRSFISHIVHDELVIDMADEDREMIVSIKDMFATNKVGTYLVNVSAGKNYFDLKPLNV